MRTLLFLACSFAFCFHLSSLSAQEAPSEDDVYYWKILSKVKFKNTFDKKTEQITYAPIFGKHIEQLEGKTITIKGYMIPADLARGKMTLSAYPFASCFFCGQAGPESVIEVEPKEPLIFRMDKPITIKGVLKLNREDPFRLLYIMEKVGYGD